MSHHVQGEIAKKIQNRYTFERLSLYAPDTDNDSASIKILRVDVLSRHFVAEEVKPQIQFYIILLLSYIYIYVYRRRTNEATNHLVFSNQTFCLSYESKSFRNSFVLKVYYFIMSSTTSSGKRQKKKKNPTPKLEETTLCIVGCTFYIRIPIGRL